MYGDTIWTATYGDTGDQCGMYVAQTADTGYVITGYTTSGGYGGQDAWVVRLESENTVGEVNILGSDAGDKTDRIRNLTVTTDTTLILYAATYGLVNQYLGNRSVTWSFITVADSFTWQAADAESIVIDPMRPGSGKLVATYTGPRRTVSCTTGIITILPGDLHHVGMNRTAASDAPFSVDTTVTTDDTLYFWCMGYDADGNVLGDTAASWFANGTLSEDAFTELSGAATAFSQKTPGTGYLYCRYTTGMKDSIKVTVQPGRLAILAIRDSSDNRGKEIDSLCLETGQTITLYVAGYDAYGNYKADQSASWYSIQDAPFFAYMSSSLTAAWDFTPTLLGRGYLYAGTGGIQDTTGLITVIKNLPPSVLLTAPSGTQIDDVKIPFVLADNENDTLDIACEYSTDHGSTWLTATVTGATDELLPAGYTDTLTWVSGMDLNGWVADSILFRLMPSDKKGGTGDTVCFGIRNILGDYNRNMTIDFEDVTAFTMAWHTTDSIKDIGPVTGLVPELLLQPDGYVEFEDLYTFVLMWDWCYRDSLADPAHYPAKTATVAGASPVSLVQMEEGTWSVRLQDIPEPMAVSLSLRFDPAQGNITGLYEGSSLQGFGCTPIFLKKTGIQGTAMVQAALLDGHWMSDNSLELATVTTEGSTDNAVQVSWDIRDFNNSVMARGGGAITVNGAIPDVSDLPALTVYPNPFSNTDAVTIQGPFSGPINIRNIKGSTVTTLYPTGNAVSIIWDGTDRSGKPVPAGIYSISGKKVRLIKLR